MRWREHTVRGRKRGLQLRRSEEQRSLRYLTWHISCVPSVEPLASDPSFSFIDLFEICYVCKTVVKFVNVGSLPGNKRPNYTVARFRICYFVFQNKE